MVERQVYIASDLPELVLKQLPSCAFKIARGRMTFGGQNIVRQVCNGVRIEHEIWPSSAYLCVRDFEHCSTGATGAAET